MFDYARRGNFNNVNIEHDGKQVVEGIFMTMLYTIDEAKDSQHPKGSKTRPTAPLFVATKLLTQMFTSAPKMVSSKDSQLRAFLLCMTAVKPRMDSAIMKPK